MDNTRISIYTPIYNRAYTINQLYQSLLRQTKQDFIWFVIDDGSTDNLRDLIDGWIDEKNIDIRYFYQDNKGKQEAVNFIHEIIDTELNVCVDSDDYLVDNAVEIILAEWEKVKHDETIAGIVGLDVDNNNNVIGTVFPETIKKAKFSEFNTKYGIRGDKKFVYKTSIIRNYRYPTIENEKFPAPGYIYRLIDQDYSLALINKVLCIVEYLPDGISKNKFSQFRKSPNSFVFYRKERMRMAINYKDKFVNAIHFIASSFFAKRNVFERNNYKITTALAFPFGVMLFLYIKYTNKKGVV